MTTGAAEVHVELIVDSNAEKATEQLKEGIDTAHTSTKRWSKELVSGQSILRGLKGVATSSYSAAAMGAKLASMAGHEMYDASMKAVEAFRESEGKVRELASTIAMLDQSGKTFTEMKDIARDLKEELEDVAINAGVTSDAIMAAFGNVLERGGKTVDQAKELVDAMSQAGRAIPGGVEGISEAFEMIEMGVVRAKNPIVGMIAATHLLKGNAKQVAAQMMKMSPEKQMALAEKAVAAMATKMEDVPLSVGEMTKSMGVFIEQITAAAGGPIMKAVAPIYKKVFGWIEENNEMLRQGAVEFGQAMGAVVDFIAPMFDVALVAGKQFVAEMRATDGPMKDLREGFGFMLDHSKEIALVMKGMIGFVLNGIEGLAVAIGKIIKTISGAIDMGERSGLFGTAGAKSAAGRDLKSAREAASAGVGGGDEAKIAELKKSYVALQSAKAPLGEAAKSAKEASAEWDASILQAQQDHAATMAYVSSSGVAQTQGDAAVFANAFQYATIQHDAGATKYEAAILKDSQELQDALIKAGPDILGAGKDALIKSLEAMGPEGQAALKKVESGWTAAARSSLTVGKGPNVNQVFTGSINVNQDFKDEDPERVAIVFRQDLAQHGLGRIGAMTAIPGGF